MTKTISLYSAAIASATAGPAISLAGVEQWLRIASLLLGIIATILFIRSGLRRDRERAADFLAAERRRARVERMSALDAHNHESPEQ